MSNTVFIGLALFSLLGVWVVLPLLPAVLIYRLFPDTSVAASGPFANLTVKASGAFAAYLIVFAATFLLVDHIRTFIGGSMRPFWEVQGEVQLLDQNGNHITQQDLLNKLVLAVNPNPLRVEEDQLTLKIPEGTGGKLPRITVTIPDWGFTAIDPEDQSWLTKWESRDNFAKTWDLGTITIRQKLAPRTYNSQSPLARASMIEGQ